MTYSVHLKLHEDQYEEEQIDEWYNHFVDEYDDVDHGRRRLEKSTDPGIVIAGATLTVAAIDTLVTIYSVLKDEPEVHYINLWGPNSERYPVQVYSHALGRIENPGQYEFHEVDDEVTLVVCDDMDEVQKIQADVDPDGLVLDLDDRSADDVGDVGTDEREEATGTE